MTSKKKIIKSIRSLEKRKKEHEIERRKEISKNKDNPVINYWEEEIKRFDKKIKEKKEKLKN